MFAYFFEWSNKTSVLAGSQKTQLFCFVLFLKEVVTIGLNLRINLLRKINKLCKYPPLSSGMTIKNYKGKTFVGKNTQDETVYSYTAFLLSVGPKEQMMQDEAG